MTSDPREVLTRPAPAPDLTVRYGDEPDQVIDFRQPRGDQRGPFVIFIHGGFWRVAYDRSHAGPLAADLADRGYPVATVEYRRVGQPGGGWPGTLDDVAAAVAAAPALITDLDLDLGRPVLAGHSAGGQLALWCAGRQPEVVRGVLALAPVADLRLAWRLGLGGGAVAEFLGGSPADLPERYAEADPGLRLPLGVRTVVLHGGADDLVPPAISREYVAAARRTGGDITLVEVPQAEHFAVIDPKSSAWPAVLTALAALTV